jgi:excisionase family DNA binding protein
MGCMPPAGYSFAEACAMLGISAHTLRRRIQAGEIRAERVDRPQGYQWRVYLDRGAGRTDVTAVPSNEPAPTQHWDRAADGRQPADGQQLALALAPLVETAVKAAVAPLRAELADVRVLLSARDQELGAMRQERDRRKQELGDVRLERDHLAEQLRSLQVPAPSETGRVPTASLIDETTQDTSEARPSRRWWQFWTARPA